MDKTILISGAMFVSVLVLLFIILIIVKSNKKNKYKKMLEDLEYQKNEIDSVPVAPELAKVESYLKNEK